MSNEDIVKGIYHAFEHNDIPTFLEALASDVAWEYPGPSNIPFTGSFHGVEAVKRYLATYSNAIAPDNPPKEQWNFFGTEAFIAQADKVVALGFEVTRIAATGKTYNAPFAHVWTLTNSKVTEFYGYYDTAAMSAAFS